MKRSSAAKRSAVDRVLRRGNASPDGNVTSKTYVSPHGERTVITCEGCGAASEVDLERGRDSDHASVKGGYFTRPCPHCGREQGAEASRRPF